MPDKLTPVERMRQALADSQPDAEHTPRRQAALAHVYHAYKPKEREQHQHVLSLKQSDPTAYAKLPLTFRIGAEAYEGHKRAYEETNQ